METTDYISSPTKQAVDSAQDVYRTVQALFREAVANFESKWTAFQEICHSQTASASLDECTRTDEFEALKKQGPKILAFVVFKLATNADDNLNGVFLFYALENDTRFRGNPKDLLDSKESLHRHSTQIVELNYKRNKTYEELVKAWKQHCADNFLIFSRAVCCDCDAYWDLLEVGPSFIPRLMVEYTHDTGGYWYELLHEIVHGHKTGAYMVVRRTQIIEVWREFFNEREYADAPKYIQTEWDVYFNTGEIGPMIREYNRRYNIYGNDDNDN